MPIKPATFVELLRYRAERQPAFIGYTFLSDGEKEEQTLTYSDLDRRARAIAGFLQSKVARGERALLLYPPGLEYIAGFLGCLYAGVIGVPAYPPDPTRLQRSLPRLQAIVKDAQATLALTTSSILSKVFGAAQQVAGAGPPKGVAGSTAQLGLLAEIQWVSTDTLEAGWDQQWKDPSIKSNDLAFLQYTSGSTGVPKGVMVSHNNLLHNSSLINFGFGLNKDHTGVMWLPIYHDMGLIGGVLQPLYAGFHTFLMSPLAFLQWPMRWLNAISRLKGMPVVSGGPNFAYDLCTQKVADDKIENLDLSNWRVAFSGAEPVRAETINRFTQTFAPCGFRREAFYPCYGLAEATLFVSGGLAGDPPVIRPFDREALKDKRVVLLSEESDVAQRLVGCGRALLDQKIAIVDPEKLTRCAANEIGEIWVSSASMAQGYWNRPEESRHIFQARIAETGEGPFMRTGDLGVLIDGELFVASRLKDLIIIRGQNHYPQDIELTVENSHAALRPNSGAVFSVDVQGQEQLAIVYEIRPTSTLSLDEVIGNIQRAVAEDHELQVYAVTLIKRGTVPKTSSGKIQRQACKRAFIEGTFEVVKEWRSTLAQSPEIIAVSGSGDVPTRSETLSDGSVREGKNEPDLSTIERWLVEHLAEVLKIAPVSIDVNQPFTSFGLDSARSVSLTGDLATWLGRPMSPTLAWDYPSVRQLARYLAHGESAGRYVAKAELGRISDSEAIAVIGMGCRLPGAKNPDEFWELLRNGIDAVREIPSDRWDVNGLYDSQPNTPGKMSTRWGGFIDEVDKFDPHFFGISPREASRMDPQQRLMLEVTWEALEDAGILPGELSGSRTSVFVGVSNIDYGRLQQGDREHMDAYVGTGNASSIVANRISYLLDLRGASMALDTACSSSLVTLHLAIRSLRNRESNLALAGGVNLILHPDVTISFSQAQMMSPDGRCKTFDASANGYVRGEGAGMVILKRLSDAQRNGDNILAILRGSAVNQDGRSNGLTAPNRLAQQAVIQEALRDAGVLPSQIGYIEAHGTGTPLGDPIEIQALGEVFKERSIERSAFVGSVKTNIGHLESAAGIAGVIKVILMLQHQEIAQHLHVTRINPHIPLDQYPLRIPTESLPWPTSKERRFAGVSSFGFGGTNAHVVLEEAPVPTLFPVKAERPLHVLVLSAENENALRALTERYATYCSQTSDRVLANICHTAASRRTHFAERLALTAESSHDIKKNFTAFLKGEEVPGLIRGAATGKSKPNIAFLFTGQGAQYPGMGRRLYNTQPTFRKALEECDKFLRPYLEKPLLEVIFPPEENASLIHETAYTQPALFALEYALATLWQSFGIKPDYVIGHSIGEYVAACISGVFSLEDGLKLVATRGRLMQSLPHNGEMAVVFDNPDRVTAALNGYQEKVSIAGVNGPTNTVISGEREAVHTLVSVFEKQGISTRSLTVSHAFHSPLMDPILGEFERIAREVHFEKPRIPIVSNLTGKLFGPDEIPDAKYWRQHIRQAVQFASGMQTLAEQKVEIFLEPGPNPTLLGMGRNCLPELSASWLPSMKNGQEDWQVLLNSIANLYVKGVEIDWNGFDRDYYRSPVQLPTYPFQRERYWTQANDEAAVQGPGPGTGLRGLPEIHPLVGQQIRSPMFKGVVFESRFSTQAFPVLGDHRIHGVPLLPAAAYMEMALAAARHAFGDGQHAVENLGILEAIPIPDESPRIVQLTLAPPENGESAFQVFSLDPGSGNGSDSSQPEESWILHGAGKIRINTSDAKPTSPKKFLPGDVQGRSDEQPDAGVFYRRLYERGFEYGPNFQGIQKIWRSDGEALGFLSLPDPEAGRTERYILHPALLDAGLQLLAAALPVAQELATRSGMFLPIGAESYRVYKRAARRLWCHVLLRNGGHVNSGLLVGDLSLYDEEGDLVAELTGLKMRQATREALPSALRRQVDSWMYHVEWRPKEFTENDRQAAEAKGHWLVFADRGGRGEDLVRRITEKGGNCIVVRSGEEFKREGEHEWVIRPDNSADFVKFMSEGIPSNGTGTRGAVYLWGLDATIPDNSSLRALQDAQRLILGGALYLVQSIAGTAWSTTPRLWLVTRGGQPVSHAANELNIAHASLWGMGNVVALEHPELRCGRADLDPQDESASLDQLIIEIMAEHEEDQVAFRDKKRFVPRLVRSTLTGDVQGDGKQMRPDKQARRLEATRKGSLSDIALVPTERHRPGPGEVEIQVFATGLNFRDVLNALGLYPGDAGPLGGECAGRVVTVGTGVTNVKAGDDVMGIASGSFGHFVTTYADLVVRKPARFSYDEAVTIPIAYLTAYYALQRLGKMSAGDRVLVHAASGGVGLAAIQLADLVGAEVYGTAGNDEKRAYLKSIGVKHVMNSRTVEFADEVMKSTNGRGIDLILNSLNGEFIPKGLSCLAPGGRFLEIGKIDIWDPERVRAFRSGVSYFTIALDSLSRENPSLIQSMFQELLGKFESGELKPLAHTAYPISDAVNAFRFMAKAKHIGKIVITQEVTSQAEPEAFQSVISPDGTYLVTGGLGALGLLVAKWLVEKGARHLLLVGRNAPGETAAETIRELENSGVRVSVASADIADERQIGEVISRSFRQRAPGAENMPPLLGVVHAAGVLDDGMLMQQDWQRFAKVLGPKVYGAWNLHTMTKEFPVDFMIYFSSMASLLGSPGQGNYAAANAFMDVLAHHRRASGLKALSINWGPWGGVGMAAQVNADAQRRRNFGGVGMISPGQGLQVLDRILGKDVAQLGVLPIQWRSFIRRFEGGMLPPLLSGFGLATQQQQTRGPKAKPEFVKQLEEAAPADRRALVLEFLRKQTIKVLGLDSSFQLDTKKPLNEMGLDSLMAIELKNSLSGAVGKNLPVTMVFNYPNVEALTGYILRDVLALEKSEEVPEEAGMKSPELGEVLSEIEKLTDEEAETLLLEKLNGKKKTE